MSRRLLAAVLVMGTAGLPAAAQDSPPRVQRPAPDFFFGEPRGSLGIRGAWVLSRAGSDLFDFVQDQLTLDKGDFNMPAIAFELSIPITSRLEAIGGFEMSQISKDSEYRHFVDNSSLPIEQTTRLGERNISGSVRFLLLPRGRAISRFAFVPRGVIPYVGAGAGALWYEFLQTGDFVDFVDRSVFSDSFSSKGWTPSAHIFGGADVHVYRRLFVTVEGRYLWAAGTPGRGFIDFDKIDLAGFRLGAGVNFVF